MNLTQTTALKWTFYALAAAAGIFATGGKSGELYRKLIEPKTHVPITVLPSTRPANAAWTFERLVEAYRVIL